MKLIEHESELQPYAPPGHSGTRNVRLVDEAFCGRFEMVLGRLDPGGRADAHAHDTQHQVIYVLKGTCDVRLDEAAPVACGPGTVVRIPPGVVHEVIVTSAETLELMVLYSPPLPPRDDAPLER